mgnify:CR=1 FL=1
MISDQPSHKTDSSVDVGQLGTLFEKEVARIIRDKCPKHIAKEVWRREWLRVNAESAAFVLTADDHIEVMKDKSGYVFTRPDAVPTIVIKFVPTKDYARKRQLTKVKGVSIRVLSNKANQSKTRKSLILELEWELRNGLAGSKYIRSLTYVTHVSFELSANTLAERRAPKAAVTRKLRVATAAA